MHFRDGLLKILKKLLSQQTTRDCTLISSNIPHKVTFMLNTAYFLSYYMFFVQFYVLRILVKRVLKCVPFTGTLGMNGYV